MLIDSQGIAMPSYSPAHDARPIRMSDFDGLYDADFVILAYHRILKRDADPSGMAHYLEQIRAGYSKTEIVVDLMSSKEALTLDTKLSGHFLYKTALLVGRIPLIGRLFELVFFLVSIRKFKRDVRALENYCYRIKIAIDRMNSPN